ncbi:MAG: TolC family protein [Bacteroidia bacterium]|nr:TolC family protein [Bacteroidia bacterium]
MKSTYRLFGLSIFLLSTTAGAQTTKSLTLDQAIELGIQESNSVKISGYKKDLAEAKVEQGWNTMIPALSYTGNYTRLSNNIEPFKIAIPGFGDKVLNPQILNQYTNKISLQSTVFAGMKGNYALKAIIQQAAASEADYRKEQADAKLSIINTYLSLFKLHQSKRIVEENLKLAEQRERDIKNMVDNGMILANDLYKARLSRNSLELSLAEVESSISNLNYSLNVMLGLPEETLIQTDEASALLLADTSGISGNLQSASLNRDEVKAQEIRTRALEYQVKSSKGSYFPTLSLGANYYVNNPNQRMFPQEAKFKDTWDLGATLSWNFTSLYTTKSYVKEAKANLEQAKAAKDQLSDAIKMESKQSWNAWQLALKKIKLAEFNVEQATENQRVMLNRFNNNAALATDLLDADNALTQAKLNLLNVRADATAAYYKALRTSGK